MGLTIAIGDSLPAANRLGIDIAERAGEEGNEQHPADKKAAPVCCHVINWRKLCPI